MKSNKLTTPVLFLVFNRPDSTKLVFNAIRDAKPTTLYVAADGPRKNYQEEIEKCLAVRAIATNVDWECEVRTLFRDGNLGCGKGVSSAITWFFEHESEGIILEDDCLPAPEFFPFCTDLLAKYRDDKRIMQIGGDNVLSEHRRDPEYSYFFSNHNAIWGWATWKRAWDLYDYKMNQYENISRKGYFDDHFNTVYEADYFTWVFKRTFVHPHITWDYQWEFVRRINSGLTIVPQKNLVTNIGFGEEATNTTGSGEISGNLKLESMDFPLRHPEFVMADTKADSHGFIKHLTSPSSRIKTIIKRMFPPYIRKKLFEAAFNRYLASYSSQNNTAKSTDKLLLWINLFLSMCESEMDVVLQLVGGMTGSFLEYF